MKNIINLKEQKHTENKKWCYFSRKGLITSNILTLSFCFCIFTVDPIWFPCPTIIHKKKLRTLYRNIITANTKSFCCIILVSSKFRSINIFSQELNVLVLLKRIKMKLPILDDYMNIAIQQKRISSFSNRCLVIFKSS